MKKISFKTLGCRVNLYETDALASRFKAAGYDIADSDADADVFVVNTCTVTNTSDQKCRQAIHQIRRKHPEALIAVTGCIGTLCVARLLQQVPGIRQIFSWLGRNSLWILCIHYCFIMLVELWIYTKGWLSNSLLDVVSNQIYGFGHVEDTPRDIVIKIAVALLSIGVSAIYAVIHKAVKARIKAARAAKAEA